MPALDVKLMTKDQDLSFNETSDRKISQHRPDQAASFSRKQKTLRDSASRAGRIWFLTGTASTRQRIQPTPLVKAGHPSRDRGLSR
jgi:hypothetical protein